MLRVQLKEITQADIEKIVDIKTDVSLWPYDYDVTDDKALMRNIVADRFNDEWYHQYLILLNREPETVIGELHIHLFEDDRNSWEIGYCVLPEYRRQGYCSEAVQIAFDDAFNQWNVYKIVAFCNEYNTGSYKVMEKCGMTRDGILRGELPWNGKRVNQYVYSILVDDYNAKITPLQSRWEKAEITALCLVCDGGKILLQDRVKQGWTGFTFPGGHIEREESFVEGIKREILEETGLTIQDPKICGIKQFQTDFDERYIVVLFKATKFSGQLISSDEGQMYWVERDKLGEYNLVDDFMAHLQVFEDENINEMIYERICTGCEEDGGYESIMKLC